MHRHGRTLRIFDLGGKSLASARRQVAVLPFLYPPPPDSPGSFNIPQAPAPGEAAGPGQLVGVHGPPG